MKRGILFILFLLILFMSTMVLTSQAHALVMPSPFCLQPSYKKPLLFPSRYYVERHKQEVQRYEKCILEFIQEQEEAIAIHKEASRRAREELERFVEQQ